MITNVLFGFFLLLTSPDQACDIFGSFYEVDDPMEAHYVVFEEGSETFADVIVFEQKNRLYADKAGLWYFEEKKANAKHRIYFTDKKREADFSVYFTRFESFAGCNL